VLRRAELKCPSPHKVTQNTVPLDGSRFDLQIPVRTERIDQPSEQICVRLHGNEPVRERLKGLDAADRHSVGLDLMRVQGRWPIGMPLCRAMGGGLWEVRANLASDRIARVLFCLHKRQLRRCTDSSSKHVRRRMKTCNSPGTEKRR
jgi:hypothetical protein